MNNHYDEDKGGYKIDIEAKDTGSFFLKVTMNYIYPYSEIQVGDPEPILTSSHIRHINTRCDFARSEIVGSGFKVIVSGEFISNSTFQCYCPMQSGRWLNVIPLKFDCRVPFCTGDKDTAMISSMSWQGTKFPWLWVPYDCYYHFYNVDEFQYCAKQNNIKWIHVMGGN